MADKSHMPHPILLIEDDPDYERLVCEILAGSDGMFDVKSASTLAAGLACIEQNKPEAILVDLNLPDSSGYGTFMRVLERADEIPIIVLTGLDDDQTAVRAVQDGAEDYIVKNLIQPKMILRHLKMAVSRHQRQAPSEKPASAPTGTVLSFIGSKGGVGTSTTAINVAAWLARNGLDTVAIELQSGRPSTLSVYLDSEPRNDLYSLCQKPPDTITSEDLKKCLAKHVAGLHLLGPSISSYSGQALGVEHVRRFVSVARRMFRFVVLDLPPQMDEAVEEALKISHSITLIVDRESTSVQCGTALMQHIRTITSQATDVGVAIVDRTGLESPPLAEIRAQLKVHPLAMIPSSAPVIALSQSAGTPLVLLYPDDPFSLAHFELVECLLASAPCDVSRSKDRTRFSRSADWRAIPETMYG